MRAYVCGPCCDVKVYLLTLSSPGIAVPACLYFLAFLKKLPLKRKGWSKEVRYFPFYFPTIFLTFHLQDTKELDKRRTVAKSMLDFAKDPKFPQAGDPSLA
jgi:hypothetical protein